MRRGLRALWLGALGLLAAAPPAAGQLLVGREPGPAPQILTTDLAREQTVERPELTVAFALVDDDDIVDVIVNGEALRFEPGDTLLIERELFLQSYQNVVSISATDVAGNSRTKSYKLIFPGAEAESAALPPIPRPKPEPVIADEVARRAPMPDALTRPGAAALNRRVYVVGGLAAEEGARSGNLRLYNPAGDKWSVLPAPAMDGHVVAASAGGRLYAVEATGRWHRYDPRSNEWDAGEGAPFEGFERLGPAAVVGETVYIFGGRAGAGDGNGASAAVAAFDTGAAAWTRVAPMPTAREGAVAAVVNGIVYVMGGYDGDDYLDVVEAYDPRQDQWRTVPAPMPTPRAYAAAGAVEGRIYVIGGATGGLFGESIVDTVEVFDTGASEDYWSPRELEPGPAARKEAGAATLGRSIYLLGGSDGDPLALTEAYSVAESGVGPLAGQFRAVLEAGLFAGQGVRWGAFFFPALGECRERGWLQVVCEPEGDRTVFVDFAALQGVELANYPLPEDRADDPEAQARSGLFIRLRLAGSPNLQIKCAASDKQTGAEIAACIRIRDEYTALQRLVSGPEGESGEGSEDGAGG